MEWLGEAEDEERALEQLHRDAMTDGLPVVVPTPRRVEDMMLASGLDPDISLGDAGPSGGAATARAVAANAVMAGCLPEHFPVVVAAVRAVCSSDYDLTEIQVTTHGITPMVIVNGPVRLSAGVASGYGCLGPGFRANASIGRAVRLVLQNIGGGRAGLSDMAIFGSPAKFTLCTGEDEEQSPWEPLHVSRGYDAVDSVATVLAVEGPHSVLCAPMPDDCVGREIEAALSTIGSALGALGANSTYLGKGDVAVLINPQMAQMLAAAGLGRAEVQRELAERMRHPRSVLRTRNPFLIPDGPGGELIPQRDPSTIVIAVAGGRGNYAIVCPTLGASAHHHMSVSQKIEIDQFCAIPPPPPPRAAAAPVPSQAD